MTFSFDLNWAAGGAAPALLPDIALCTGPCGWLDIIESVVIQSSSRELYRMTRDALLCAYGDYTAGIQMAVADALGASPDGREGQPVGQPSNAAQGKKRIYIDIPMACFQSNGLNTAALFLEPVRAVINLKPKWDFYYSAVTVAAVGPPVNTVGAATWSGSNAAAGGVHGVDVTITDPVCIMQQVSLSAELTASTLSANYSAGSLSQLSYNYVQETVTNEGTLAAANTMPTERLSHTITSTSCVEDIYCFAEVDGAQYAATVNDMANAANFVQLANFNGPIPLRSIRLEASGQVLCDVPAKYLGCFGKPTQSAGFYQSAGQGGTSSKSGQGHNPDGNPLNTKYIYRICLSESASKLYSGNMWNLRELSNVTISAELPIVSGTQDPMKNTTYANDFVPTYYAGLKVKFKVILRTAGLISTNSENGRCVAVLSN